MVGVVEQDHVAGLQVPRSARRDALRGRELAPVLAPTAPEERFEVLFAGCFEACTRVDAERRAVEGRVAGDCLLRSPQVVLDRGFREPGLDLVAVAVDADLVASCGDL